MHEEPRPSAVVRRRQGVRVFANQPLDLLRPLEGDGRGQRDGGTAGDQQARHLVFAVQRCLIQRRQADGVLETQVGPELDQRGERRSLLLDDREVQRRAAVIRAIHPLIEIGAGFRQLANDSGLAHRDG